MPAPTEIFEKKMQYLYRRLKQFWQWVNERTRSKFCNKEHVCKVCYNLFKRSGVTAVVHSHKTSIFSMSLNIKGYRSHSFHIQLIVRNYVFIYVTMQAVYLKNCKWYYIYLCNIIIIIFIIIKIIIILSRSLFLEQCW